MENEPEWAPGDEAVRQMCKVGESSVWICDGRSSSINVVSLESGDREFKTSQLRTVSDLAAGENVVVLAGQVNSGGLVHGLEIHNLATGQRLMLKDEFRMLFSGVVVSTKRLETAFFLQQDASRTGTSERVSDTLVQADLANGSVRQVSKSGANWMFLVPVLNAVWAFDNTGGVCSCNLGSATLDLPFSLNQPLLMGTYIPSIRRLVGIARNQSILVIHPEYKTIQVVSKSVPVSFMLGSRAMCVIKGGYGQLLVGGESIAMYKIHRIKQASEGKARTRPISRQLSGNQKNSRLLDAVGQQSKTLNISSRASMYVSDSMEELIRDLTASSKGAETVASSTGDRGEEATRKVIPPALRRQESAFIDDDGFESMIRDLTKPLESRNGEPVAVVQQTPPGAAVVRPPSPRNRPSGPATTTSSTVPPVRLPAGSSSAQPGSPRRRVGSRQNSSSATQEKPLAASPSGSTNAAQSSGAKIRAAYGVKDKVRVRASPSGSVFPFQLECAAGKIGWGKKEADDFVFYDLTGSSVLLKIPLVEMESAKKSSASTVITVAPSRKPAPQIRARPPNPQKRSTKSLPRQHMISSKGIQDVVFQWFQRYEDNAVLLQFRGWAHVLAQVLEDNVRIELICKLYFEFLNPVNSRNTSKLPLRVDIVDGLVKIIQPLVQADDLDGLCALPMDLFDEALDNAETVLHEKLFHPFLKDMRARARKMEAQSQSVSTNDIARELSAVRAATKLTFEEFLAVIGKYRSTRPAASLVDLDDGGLSPRTSSLASGASSPRGRPPSRAPSDLERNPSVSSGSEQSGRFSGRSASVSSGGVGISPRAKSNLSRGGLAEGRSGSVGSETENPRFASPSAHGSGSSTPDGGPPIPRRPSGLTRLPDNDEFVIPGASRNVARNPSPYSGNRTSSSAGTPPMPSTPPPSTPPARLSAKGTRFQSQPLEEF